MVVFNFGTAARIFALAVTLPLYASATPAWACACCGTFQVVKVAPDDVLNIRTGPGIRYRIKGGIPSGSACVIKTGRCKGRWCKIIYGQTRGWVHAGYLRYMASPKP